MTDVLVIDPNQSIRKMYVAGLTGFGFSVTEADSHAQAQEQLESGNIPAVMIVDWTRNHDEGRAFIHLLHDTPAYQSIKIIISTVNSLSETEEAELDVSAVMVKPIDLSQLVKAVYLFHRPGTKT